MLVTQVISAMTVTLCLLIDSIMIGRFLGVDPMTAYGLSNPLLLIFAALGTMISAGVQVMCGKSIGSGDRDGTDANNPQGHPRLMEPVQLEPAVMDGKTVLPFRLTYRVRGSSCLMVKPYGEITEVRMHSNCPDPSFTGDFLPSEREVGEEGFTARWTVSKINRGAPDDTSFGVNLLSGVILQQMSQHRGAGQVIDGDHVITFRAEHLTERKAADATKAVDSNFHHGKNLLKCRKISKKVI